MSKSLWSEVLEGTFDTSGYSNDNQYDAEIESMVTSEPETMVAYVGSCIEGMLAVDTAVALMEGRCAVQYVQGNTEEAKATMEGVLRNAWETLKEWVRKAYRAIKKFIKKAWNKMKGYVNVFRGMVTKYNYILKGKVNGNLMVDWVEVNMAGGHQAFENALTEIDNAYRGKNSTPTTSLNKNFHDQLEAGFFPDRKAPTAAQTAANQPGDSYGRFVRERKWSEVGRDCIRVADDGFDKAYSEAFKIGELTERDIIKDINDEGDERMDKNDDSSKSDKAKDKTERNINAFVRRKTNVVRTYTQMVNSAASLQVRLAVKACRKAIRHQAENSSATYGIESTTDFSAVMGEIL